MKCFFFISKSRYFFIHSFQGFAIWIDFFCCLPYALTALLPLLPLLTSTPHDRRRPQEERFIQSDFIVCLRLQVMRPKLVTQFVKASCSTFVFSPNLDKFFISLLSLLVQLLSSTSKKSLTGISSFSVAIYGIGTYTTIQQILEILLPPISPQLPWLCKSFSFQS